MDEVFVSFCPWLGLKKGSEKSQTLSNQHLLMVKWKNPLVPSGNVLSHGLPSMEIRSTAISIQFLMINQPRQFARHFQGKKLYMQIIELLGAKRSTPKLWTVDVSLSGLSWINTFVTSHDPVVIWTHFCWITDFTSKKFLNYAVYHLVFTHQLKL